MWVRNWLARQLIGEDLKAMRLSKRLSQRQLSLRSSVSERTIRRVENGVGTVNVGCLILLAIAMGQTLDMFRSVDNLSASNLRDLRRSGQKAATRFRQRR